ncbi:MAG: 4-hydroxy-3-methylbut-2-enyl diphosphate reductase [Syntrophobacteraceae bacterium]|nr:4-hydroxy-3-methylbut-2-enyl diphosphate reductase [Desulfobacteraceae bacterium]
MKVVVAKTGGFCKGVKSALEITLESIQNRKDGEEICTFGPLIHNRQVLEMLEEKGIRAEESIDACAGKKVVIRAHGIPPAERQKLHLTGASLLDATCKRVAKVHAAIKQHARQGFHTVIVGDADHAEVIGLMGYTDGRGVVISAPDEVDALPAEWENVLLVAQTTQNEDVFNEVHKRFLERYPAGVVKNTICDSTHERQREVRHMCSHVEAMVIVGGKHSGNTVRLAEVARECGIPTYHVETEKELDPRLMARYKCVGVSAGASTPNWIIRNVVQHLESIRTTHLYMHVGMKMFLELCARANVYVALGAALLPFVFHALTGVPWTPADSGMAAFYAFAMHSLNIYLDRNALQLNDPGRAAFYHRWRYFFTLLSVAGVALSLNLALGKGFMTFFLMAVLVLLGILYAVPLFFPPSGRWKNITALAIKDIPTSKTFLVPIAWASVVVFVPHLFGAVNDYGDFLYAFWVIFLMVLIRTCLLDLLAVQGDRLVGKETLVVLIGEKRTTQFTLLLLAILAATLVLGPLAKLSSGFACLMLPIVGVDWWLLKVCSAKQLKGDPGYEALIEGVIICVGFLAMLTSYPLSLWGP